MRKKTNNRSGLAMVEFVLALPFLLFIFALIVNAGAISAWKVKEQSIARLAVWETRWPRSNNDPLSAQVWPAGGTSSASDQGNVAGMDDSRVDLPVARGPLPPATVNSNLLDPTRGLREGQADLSRKYPLMGKLPQYDIKASTWLVDDKWQYNTPTMGMNSNMHIRIPIIYTLPTASSSMMSGYIGAAMSILGNSLQASLSPLDHDQDFIFYSQLFGGGGSAPDFQPRLSRFCTTSKSVSDQQVQNLIDRIQGNKKKRIPSLPKTMTEAFLGMYEGALSRLQGILSAKPPAPPAARAAAQSQIPGLKSKISALQQYIGQIGKNGGG